MTARSHRLFPEKCFVAIDAAAKDGSAQLVARGDDFARARWHAGAAPGERGMWVYDTPGMALVHQINFEPTHYAVAKEDVDAPSM